MRNATNCYLQKKKTKVYKMRFSKPYITIEDLDMASWLRGETNPS
jgi:hypothetical protein